MPRPRFASLEPERRTAILAAAAAEIAESGLDGASYNRIIERAGVSKGAMYYYFDDREDLCLTVVREAVDRAVAQIGPPIAFDDARGFWDSLADLYARALQFVEREPQLAGLLRALLARPSESASSAITAYTEQAHAFLAELLARGRALGAVRDDLPTDLLARLLVATGDVSDRWLLERWDELPDRTLERYASDVLALHMRVAAPLELVLERERSES
jgi:AcrR family transcriptional regulator